MADLLGALAPFIQPLENTSEAAVDGRILEAYCPTGKVTFTGIPKHPTRLARMALNEAVKQGQFDDKPLTIVAPEEGFQPAGEGSSEIKNIMGSALDELHGLDELLASLPPIEGIDTNALIAQVKGTQNFLSVGARHGSFTHTLRSSEGLPSVARIGDDGQLSYVTVGANLDEQGIPTTLNLKEYSEGNSLLQLGSQKTNTAMSLCPVPDGIRFLRETPDFTGTILTHEHIGSLPKGDYSIPPRPTLID